MWRPIKAVILTAASVVAVPYAIAVLANILYGWPLGPRRYHRALHPLKVLAVNYAIVRQLTKVRYLGLALRWRQFYVNAPPSKLLRDLQYSSNGNCVDVYLPPNTSSLRPVVIFIYGGTWGSGDKNMYGLLCCELANSLASVVLCPNYSVYPKGFVDDMVQDISDVLAFVQQHSIEFYGDKDRVVLMGHSAGAHLAVMTVLELTLKRLSDKPQLFTESNADNVQRQIARQFPISYISTYQDIGPQATTTIEEIERRVDETSVKNADHPASEEAVVNDQSLCEVTVITDLSADDSDHPVDESIQSEETVIELVEENATESFYMVEDNQSNKQSENFESCDIQSSPLEIEVSQTTQVSQRLPNEQSSQLENNYKDLLSSIQLVIGLAGVYDINIHYSYETWRGVEDISTMARAMYGPKQFDRFSPTVIVPSLPPRTRLPDIHLIHGNCDDTVPESQSHQFGQTVCEHTVGRITETVIIGCGHTDICLDLMDRNRQWYHVVKTDISNAFNRLMNI